MWQIGEGNKILEDGLQCWASFGADTGNASEKFNFSDDSSGGSIVLGVFTVI